MEKASVIFLPAPTSLNEDMLKFSGSLKAEVGILLPIEIAPGEKTFDPETLTWEMIISGMLEIISASGRYNLSENPTDSPPGKVKINSGDIISGDKMSNIPPEWIDYYRRFVLTVKPEIYHEFTGASIIKARNGEFDMALEINAVLEGLFPGSPGVLLNKALILEDRAAALEKKGRVAHKENAEALEAYETALSLEAVLPDTLFNAGFFFLRRNSFARARDCFLLYVASGEKSEIPRDKKKQAEKIIKDLGDLDDISFQEAYDCVNSGKDQEALTNIRSFIEKHPKVWNGWFLLGWTLRKLGRYEDGLDSLKKAEELGGTNCDVQNETAICLMELGDLKSARKELERALYEEPENIKIISNLGVLALKAGKRQEAEAFFRTVLELDPEDALARRYLEKNE
jgi:tetratricopeptide (TPR) repeat protein